MNKFYPNKWRSFIILCFFVLFCVSCESLGKIKTSVFEWAGFSTQTKKEKKSPDTKIKNQKDKNTPKITPDTKKEKKPEVVITHDEKPTPEKTKDLKQPKVPQFRVEAPVDVQKRVGGVARSISADETFVYIDFPQHFAVYDHQLGLLGQVSVSYPVLETKKISKNDKTQLYLKEEKNTFEIVEMTQNEKGLSLVKTNSYEVDGDFYWIHPELMIVFLKDKIQFLNLANLNDIKIINETPITGVTAALLSDKYLYISHAGFLDILDLDKFSTTASIRVGRKFGFLGTVETGNAKDLLLSYLSEKNELEGIQYLRLTDDRVGIKDFGENIILEPKLKNISVDLQNQLIAGKKTGDSESLELYSISHKRFLRGTLDTNRNLISWFLSSNRIFLISGREISVSQINLDQNVISQSASLQQVSEPQNTPLAQIGAEKTLKDEFTLTSLQKMDFMSDARKVLLLDGDHILIMENTNNQKFYRLSASSDFGKDDFTIFEPTSKIQTKYEKTLVTGFGVLAYSRELGEIHFFDVSLKTAQVLPLKVASLSSWTYFSSEEKDYLAISSELKVNPSKPSSHEVALYELASPTETRLIQKIRYNLKPFVFYVPDNQIVILTNEKMELFQWSSLMQPGTKNLSPDETIDVKPLGKNFLEARLSPKNDTIYTLTDRSGKNEIFVMSLLDVSLNVTLSDIDITNEQFDGASFSKQGRLFILPTSEGTLFYDMTKLKKIREVAHWPLPAEHIDIAAKGEFICVALGFKGVYCGKLLF